MNIYSLDSKKCTGCAVCKNLCPHSAIRMESNKEGFLYPIIDIDNCIDCGLCAKKCPQLSDKANDNTFSDHMDLIALSKLQHLSKYSASGGIFATIAHGLFSKYEKVCVCGASFIDGEVQHVIIDKADDIKLLQNSKYVQSNIRSAYARVRDRLSQGFIVLFSGTPCQVEGIRNFIGCNNDKLFTIDIVCHGVPSPLFLKKDLRLYLKREANCSGLIFRRKNRLFKSKSQFCMSFYQETNRKKTKVSVLPSHDPYYNLFMTGCTFRESCYTCKYANLKRVGDITIGDCDTANLYKDFHPNEATSVVMINNPQGKRLWDLLEELFESQDLDIGREAMVNHQLDHPFPRPEVRDTIYDEIETLPIEEIALKYSKPHDMKSKMWETALAILPNSITNKVLSILKRQ